MARGAARQQRYTPDVIMKSGLFACVNEAEKHAAGAREHR
jgi:hypothetical protein